MKTKFVLESSPVPRCHGHPMLKAAYVVAVAYLEVFPVQVLLE